MIEVKLQAALVHAGVNRASFLGEGAWHYAWKVCREEKKLVLRIPKAIAYGKSVSFDEEAFKAEYAGTELYYWAVNKAQKGAAPDFFKFHVSSELTYTLETFRGKQIDLHSMTEKAAFQIGSKVGSIQRKTEDVPHGLSGFGYLTWSEENGLKGTLNGDVHEFLKEESKEHLADYQTLCLAHPKFEDSVVSKALQLAVTSRKKAFTKPQLVNQDASPENILIDENGLCLIDPYPSIYYSRGMAGNFMNLYETFFIALSDTPRYSRHQFSTCAAKLKLVAQGYITGYSAGNRQIASEVRGEQLLQLLETAYSHFCLLSEDLAEETKIRYGSKEEIEARLPVFCEELKDLASSQIDELLYFQPKK